MMRAMTMRTRNGAHPMPPAPLLPDRRRFAAMVRFPTLCLRLTEYIHSRTGKALCHEYLVLDCWRLPSLVSPAPNQVAPTVVPGLQNDRGLQGAVCIPAQLLPAAPACGATTRRWTR